MGEALSRFARRSRSRAASFSAAARAAAAFWLLVACRSAAPHAEQAPSALGPSVAEQAPLAPLAPPALGSASAPPAVTAERPPAAGKPALAPLGASSGIVALAVPGFGDAAVSVPLGAKEPRRVALALHGNFDRPEWQCEVWRQITQGELFVLCPRGIPRRDVPKQQDRWEWGTLAKTREELLAALGALRARFPEHARSGPVIFTGFSLGAILGARLIQDPALEIGAAVLTEGGYAGWTPAKAKAAAASLKSVLFACGQTDCRNKVRQSLPQFEKAGLRVTLVADVKAGHTYDGAVAREIQKEWPALLSALDPPP